MLTRQIERRFGAMTTGQSAALSRVTVAEPEQAGLRIPECESADELLRQDTR